MIFPKITQEPIKYVDAAPDKEYPLRILKAYRADCDCRWSGTTTGEEPGPIFQIMNEHQEQRAKILDEAIKALENYYNQKG